MTDTGTVDNHNLQLEENSLYYMDISTVVGENVCIGHIARCSILCNIFLYTVELLEFEVAQFSWYTWVLPHKFTTSIETENWRIHKNRSPWIRKKTHNPGKLAPTNLNDCTVHILEYERTYRYGHITRYSIFFPIYSFINVLKINEILSISFITITTDKLITQKRSIKHKTLPLSDRTVSWVLQQSPAILKPEFKIKTTFITILILFNN